MIYATYRASVSAATGEPDYRARAQLLNATDHETASVTNAATEAILVQPRLALQAAGDVLPLVAGRARWLHDGFDPGTGEPIAPVTVSADLLGCSEEWKWRLAASRGSTRGGDLVKNPIGYELDRGGPPPGRAMPIDVVLDLFDLQAAATLSATLISGGRVAKSGRKANAEEHSMEITGAGFAARYARVKIDLTLAQDHGLTHGEVAVYACQLAGVPDDEILIDGALGAPRTRAIRRACVGLFEILKDVLAPIGYRPGSSREPRGIAAYPVLIDEDGAPVLVLTQADLTSGGVETEADADVPPCVRVTGTDPNSRLVPLKGTVTTTTTTETYETDFVWRRAVANQDASGAITAIAGGGDVVLPGLTLTERVILLQTYTDGCLVRTRTTQWAWRLIEHYRYTLSASADGLPYGYPVCYFFDDVPVKDDGQDAYWQAEERFRVVSEQLVEIERDAEGFETGTSTKTAAFGWPEVAVKNRGSVASPWEDEPYTATTKIQGSGTGRLTDHEQLFVGPARPDVATSPGGTLLPTPLGVENPITPKYLEQVDLVRLRNECGEEIGTEENFYRLGLRPGLTNLHADGTESAEGVEAGRLDETTKVTRIAEGPTSHTEVTSGTAPTGKAECIKPKKLVVVRGVQGALPNVPRCLPEEAEEGGTEFAVTVCLERVVEGDEANPLTEDGAIVDLSSDFVESEEEAGAWASIELEIEAGIRGKLVLPYASPLIERGATLRLDIPDRGFDGELVIVEDYQFSIGDGGTLSTEVGVRFSLWA